MPQDSDAHGEDIANYSMHVPLCLQSSLRISFYFFYKISAYSYC